MAGPLAQLTGLADADLPGLIRDLTARRLTVAAAESLTGGLLTALLTEVPGASAVVRGGLVVYATELKHALAGVDARLLRARGPVHPEVAFELADGARTACGAVLGLGLTGVAGPEPQDGVPVGTWFVAVSSAGRRELTAHFPDDRSAAEHTPPGAGLSERDRLRFAAVRAAVDLLRAFAPAARS